MIITEEINTLGGIFPAPTHTRKAPFNEQRTHHQKTLLLAAALSCRIISSYPHCYWSMQIFTLHKQSVSIGVPVRSAPGRASSPHHDSHTLSPALMPLGTSSMNSVLGNSLRTKPKKNVQKKNKHAWCAYDEREEKRN